MTGPDSPDGWDPAIPRCTATSTRSGARCRQRPISGGTVCVTHGGRAPQVRAAATARLAAAAAAADVATYGARRDIDPAEALLEEVQWSAGHVAWLRARVGELDAKALAMGVAEQRVSADGSKVVVIRAQANVWVDLYERERRHLVAVCAAALRAGIEDRTVRLAERQGELLAVVIRGVLTDLDLSAAQQARVAEVVPRHLRAIGTGHVGGAETGPEASLR